MARCWTSASTIDPTRRQYSAACRGKEYSPNCLGNEHRVIRGIWLINCVYVNAETGQFWVWGNRLRVYRLFNPDGDGRSKLDPVSEMLNGVV